MTTALRAVQSQLRIGWRTPWAYRASALLSAVILAAEIALYTVVWRAIYRGHSGTVHGTPVAVAVAYVVLGLAYLLTFLLPLAFAAYFPAAILLGRSDGLFVPVWLAACSPLVGVVLFAAAVGFFHRQIRYYLSPGH